MENNTAALGRKLLRFTCNSATTARFTRYEAAFLGSFNLAHVKVYFRVLGPIVALIM